MIEYWPSTQICDQTCLSSAKMISIQLWGEPDNPSTVGDSFEECETDTNNLININFNLSNYPDRLTDTDSFLYRLECQYTQGCMSKIYICSSKKQTPSWPEEQVWLGHQRLCPLIYCHGIKKTCIQASSLSKLPILFKTSIKLVTEDSTKESGTRSVGSNRGGGTTITWQYWDFSHHTLGKAPVKPHLASALNANLIHFWCAFCSLFFWYGNCRVRELISAHYSHKFFQS